MGDPSKNVTYADVISNRVDVALAVSTTGNGAIQTVDIITKDPDTLKGALNPKVAVLATTIGLRLA